MRTQRADDGRVSVFLFSLPPPPAASNYSYASKRILDAIRREARASARDPDSADARRGAVKARARKPRLPGLPFVVRWWGITAAATAQEHRSAAERGASLNEMKKKKEKTRGGLNRDWSTSASRSRLAFIRIRRAPCTTSWLFSLEMTANRWCPLHIKWGIFLRLVSAVIGRKLNGKHKFRLYSRWIPEITRENMYEYIFCSIFNICFNLTFNIFYHVILLIV